MSTFDTKADRTDELIYGASSHGTWLGSQNNWWLTLSIVVVVMICVVLFKLEKRYPGQNWGNIAAILIVGGLGFFVWNFFLFQLFL